MPNPQLIKQTVTQFAEANLTAESHYLADVTVRGSEGGTLKISVLLDGDEGITIDDCIALSRKLSRYMEEEGEAAAALTIPYILEVSSPGIDFPLETPRQYRKNTGRRLKVTLTDGTEHEGLLTEVTETGFVLEEEKAPAKGKKKIKEPITYEYVQIKNSRVIITFR